MRLILIATVGYVIGIMWELYLKISLALFFSIAIVLFIFYVQARKNRIRYLKVFMNKSNLKAFTIFIIFFTISVLHIKILNKNHEKIYNSLTNQKVTFVAKVVSDKKEGKYKDTYTVKIIYAISQNNKIKINNKFLMRIKNKNVKLDYGDKIAFIGEFERATSRSNYKGFSYEEYLKSIGVYGIIDVPSEEIKVIKKNSVNIISSIANKCRRVIIERITYILQDDTKDLALGFLLGYTEEMDESIKEAFRDSSLSHMLAVSGAHISYIIMGISLALNKIKMDKKISRIVTINILILFMFITGFSPSVTRACIMGICVLLAGILYRQTDFINSISLALIIILMKNPFSIYNIGLQLSFGGTIGIVLFSKNIIRGIDILFHNYTERNSKTEKNIISINKNKHKILKCIKDMMVVVFSAQIIIIPITILNFNTISLTFFISNILASPLMGIITIGGFVLLFISFISLRLSIIFSFFYKCILNLLIIIVKFCSKIPFSKIYVITIDEVIILVYYILIILINYFFMLSSKYRKSSIENLIYMLMKKTKKNLKRIIKNIIIVAIIMLFIKAFFRNFKGLQIYFVDVGQGDCTVMITPNNKKIIVDGGGNSNNESNYDIGENVVLPYLLDRKIRKLDYMIISHFDSDHYQGLEYVIKNINVKKVIIPKQLEENYNCKEFLKIANKKRVKVIEVKAGDKIKLDKNMYMQVLWPTEEAIMENITNNNSLVCKIYYHNSSILFTGDIEKVAEEAILAKYKTRKILKSDILKVAHHGSKTSSIEDFLNMVKPKIALIGVGKDNKFGHPNNDVIERLKSIGTKIFRTDIDGEIEILINKRGKIKKHVYIN